MPACASQWQPAVQCPQPGGTGLFFWLLMTPIHARVGPQHHHGFAQCFAAVEPCQLLHPSSQPCTPTIAPRCGFIKSPMHKIISLLLGLSLSSNKCRHTSEGDIKYFLCSSNAKLFSECHNGNIRSLIQTSGEAVVGAKCVII